MIRFRTFTFDPDSGELFDGGRRLPLEHQPANVLKRLLDAPGQVVSRAVLIDTIWARETHVNFDDNLNYSIRHLRRLLGDDARCPRFIETLPRRGYRFVAPVEAVAEVTERRQSLPRVRPTRYRWILAGASLALLLGIVESMPNNHHDIAVAWLGRLHAIMF